MLNNNTVTKISDT